MRTGILTIETSGEYCSVAFSEHGIYVFDSICYIKHTQAGMLADLVKSVLQSANKNIASLAAVAVGSGPGSYTGLRIGLSLAKGICFANEIPLLSVSSMENIANQAFAINSDIDSVLVTLDAKRNEVFGAVINRANKYVMPTMAMILGETALDEYVLGKKIGIAGDGADKTVDFFKDTYAFIKTGLLYPNAQTALKLAFEKFDQSEFEHLAEFEPTYIKPVYITAAH